MMEFHISRQSRDRYKFDQELFSFNGNVIFANFHAVRIFVQKMNKKKDLANYPEQAIKAGQVNAMGLIDEILHFVMSIYRRQINPQAMAEATIWLEEKVGQETLEQTLLAFTQDFPPLNVYLNAQTEQEFLAGDSNDGTPNTQTTLEEMLLLWVANKNPAFAPYFELFDDNRLEKFSAYRTIIKELYAYFETQPPFGPDQQNLIDMLRSPAVAVPHSLTGQLEYIRSRWADLLGSYLYRLLSSLDLIKEEEKMGFTGPGPIAIPTYDHLEDVENFSPDKDWMPRLVMIAKNTFVWLSQLSEKYQTPINRLDQIPDEELNNLAREGFTGLWLIGLWERSKASARIKQLCGNPEAISSAYSLYSYEIADELGGEDAYRNLKDRAWQHGIRLASDMVPNHMAIDSWWVAEHPDWFLSLDYCPFPSYSFNGPDLSSDPRVSIHIEDHYFDRSDAAVVFKREDRQTWRTSYIYHGNDGTSMPWNDTAQLNYLNPEVREQVIQTILSVARRFPIIRFDAAMTLAKKHYQRLWFPEPGSGGDIATRADHGMTR
ncbi:MAG: alpha-amylase, partial [Anaerolineaceae bacterium]|nr:alpha-amylase [Anaerolineaceae bacterium]